MSVAAKDKALDKVRKCLALSKSANEHEAAAALRQAQKMMKIHGLTDDEVGLVEYLSMQVISDYEFPKGRLEVKDGKPNMRRPMPLTVGCVSALMRHAMGVTAIMERQQKGNAYFIAVRYFGTRQQVTLAAHAHEVVYRACGRAWKAYLKENPYLKGAPGARSGFYNGWCSAVAKEVQELVVSPEDREKTDRKVASHYGAKPPEGDKNKRKIFGETLDAGMAAGADFKLHRPIEESKARIGFNREGAES